MTQQKTRKARRVTSGQAAFRRRAAGIEFRPAIRMAVDTFFDFTHRAAAARALWSERCVVWLGRSTFLHWALNDAEIDIPWVVTKAKNAPRGVELRKAVEAELIEYFAKQLSALPEKNPGKWQPLP